MGICILLRVWSGSMIHETGHFSNKLFLLSPLSNSVALIESLLKRSALYFMIDVLAVYHWNLHFPKDGHSLVWYDSSMLTGWAWACLPRTRWSNSVGVILTNNPVWKAFPGLVHSFSRSGRGLCGSRRPKVIYIEWTMLDEWFWGWRNVVVMIHHFLYPIVLWRDQPPIVYCASRIV